MNVVIPLAPRRRAQPSEASPATRQEPATILFFTGVRYERQSQPVTPEPVAAEPVVRRRQRPVAATPARSPRRAKKATGARQPA